MLAIAFVDIKEDHEVEENDQKNMIEEIFDLRNLTNYHEQECHNNHKNSFTRIATNNEFTDYKKTNVNNEINDILKMADIEVAIRLIGTLGVSKFEKKFVRTPEINYVKKTRHLLKILPEDKFIYIQFSNKAVRYKTPELNIKKGDNSLVSDLPPDLEIDLHSFIEDVYDDNIVFNNDEEMCQDQEDANVILIKNEPFVKKNLDGNFIEDKFTFEKLLQTNLTAHFLSCLNIHVDDRQFGKEKKLQKNLRQRSSRGLQFGKNHIMKSSFNYEKLVTLDMTGVNARNRNQFLSNNENAHGDDSPIKLQTIPETKVLDPFIKALNTIKSICKEKMNTKKLIEKFYQGSDIKNLSAQKNNISGKTESDDSELDVSDEMFLTQNYNEVHITPTDFNTMDEMIINSKEKNSKFIERKILNINQNIILNHFNSRIVLEILPDPNAKENKDEELVQEDNQTQETEGQSVFLNATNFLSLVNKPLNSGQNLPKEETEEKPNTHKENSKQNKGKRSTNLFNMKKSNDNAEKEELNKKEAGSNEGSFKANKSQIQSIIYENSHGESHTETKLSISENAKNEKVKDQDLPKINIKNPSIELYPGHFDNNDSVVQKRQSAIVNKVSSPHNLFAKRSQPKMADTSLNFGISSNNDSLLKKSGKGVLSGRQTTNSIDNDVNNQLFNSIRKMTKNNSDLITANKGLNNQIMQRKLLAGSLTANILNNIKGDNMDKSGMSKNEKKMFASALLNPSNVSMNKSFTNRSPSNIQNTDLINSKNIANLLSKQFTNNASLGRVDSIERGILNAGVNPKKMVKANSEQSVGFSLSKAINSILDGNQKAASKPYELRGNPMEDYLADNKQGGDIDYIKNMLKLKEMAKSKKNVKYNKPDENEEADPKPKRQDKKDNLAKRLFKNIGKMDKGQILGKYYNFMLHKKMEMGKKDRVFFAVTNNHIIEFEDLANMYPVLASEGKNANGHTPLHIAVLSGHTGMVHKILAKGGNPNIQDKKGNTPLHLAFIGDQNEMIDSQINNGANQQITNNQCKTPWNLMHSK